MGERANSVSVFFPAYNDAPSLPGLLAKTFQVLELFVRDYEVIVVNDGSTDETGQVLRDLQGVYGDRLRVITHPENRGYGGALQTGFQAARKELVFYTDGDAQYDVLELPLLLEQMTPGTGLVNGFKLQREDPWHRIMIGWLYNRFARVLFRIRLRDIDCDFRLIRRSLLERIKLSSTSGTICVELVRKLELSHCSVVEVPVHHYARLYGRSQFFRVRSLLTTFEQLLRLYFRLVVVPSPMWRRLSACRVETVLAAWRRHGTPARPAGESNVT
jgi:glycosyltransferase involved in cell wall biosynthesis